MSDDVEVGRRHDQEGVAAVEFALISFVFLMIVFGIIAYGVYFATQQAFSHAASEAALLAAELDAAGQPDYGAARALVADQLGFLDGFDVNNPEHFVEADAPCEGCVKVELRFRWSGAGEIFPVPFVPTPEWVRADAVVRTW